MPHKHVLRVVGEAERLLVHGLLGADAAADAEAGRGAGAGDEAVAVGGQRVERLLHEGVDQVEAAGVPVS